MTHNTALDLFIIHNWTSIFYAPGSQFLSQSNFILTASEPVYNIHDFQPWVHVTQPVYDGIHLILIASAESQMRLS